MSRRTLVFIPPLLTAAVIAFGAVGPTAKAGSGIGVFDVGCKYSHSLMDDPIVFPRQPGKSHMHDFFGNQTTDAFSTGDGLLGALRGSRTNTTCDDADGSAYWVPALYRDGVKLDPLRIHVYYRTEGGKEVHPFPTGFQMIAHFNHDMMDGHVYWSCDGQGERGRWPDRVPVCLRLIHLSIGFPTCWDGVRLTTPDQSHVSYDCDPAHPVKLPRIVIFAVYPADNRKHAYTLASGAPMTAHADFLAAWEPARLAELVGCLNRRVDCKEHDKGPPPPPPPTPIPPSPPQPSPPAGDPMPPPPADPIDGSPDDTAPPATPKSGTIAHLPSRLESVGSLRTSTRAERGRFVVSARLQVAESPELLGTVVVSCPVSFLVGRGGSAHVVVQRFDSPVATCQWQVAPRRTPQFLYGAVRVQAGDAVVMRWFVRMIPARR